MRRISIVALAFAGSILLLGTTAVPAQASSGTTGSTVTVSTDALSITVPSSPTGITLAPGANATVQLGTTSVSDLRAGSAGWTVTVALSTYTGVTATNTFTDSTAVYTPTAASVTGTSAVTNKASTSLVGAGSVVQTAVVTGNNTASWTATLTVTLPDAVIADTYTAVLTESVA